MKHKSALIKILGVCVIVYFYYLMIEARVSQSETEDLGFRELLSSKYPLNRIFIIVISVVLGYAVIKEIYRYLNQNKNNKDK